MKNKLEKLYSNRRTGLLILIGVILVVSSLYLWAYTTPLDKEKYDCLKQIAFDKCETKNALIFVIPDKIESSHYQCSATSNTIYDYSLDEINSCLEDINESKK